MAKALNERTVMSLPKVKKKLYIVHCFLKITSGDSFGMNLSSFNSDPSSV